MNPTNANMYKETRIQMPTTGGNDHVKANNGGSETNQGNGDKK